MKVLSVLVGLAALLQPCFSLEEIEAARVLYYFSVYDLDVAVYGQGRGNISPDCKGIVLPGGQCTFDEFVNFIAFGEASTEPSYYDLSSGFSFYPADIAAMVAALSAVEDGGAQMYERTVKGRRTPVGIFDDLAIIVDRDHERAQSRNIGITRHLTNLKEAMIGLRAYSEAKLQGDLATRMENYNKEVIWKLIDRESEYRKAGWHKIDWKATVAANPDLAYASTDLYKNTVKALKGFDDFTGVMEERTMAYKVANTFNACFNK